MSRPLYIIGVGGFGREVLSIVRDAGLGHRFAGFVDDAPSDENCRFAKRMDAQVVGTLSTLLELRNDFDAVIAIGRPTSRRTVDEKLSPSRVTFPTLVHPHATLGAGVILGPGVVIAPGARLSVNIEVGRHVHVDQNVTVGHDSVVRPFARLNPQACVSGRVTVGTGTLVGASATVLQGITVGAGAVIGAGAVVTRDVIPGSTVKDVPAR